MRKTLFAGLTQLDPADPLSSDNYSFQSIDPDIIDRLLEVGAVTHRHDNHLALGDPVDAPFCASGVGGQIPGGVTFEFAYTWLDDNRGETLASPVCSVTTPDLLAAPTSAPVGSADYAAGSLSGDAYYYAATWVDAGGGETTLGAIEAVDVDPAVNAQVLLSGLTANMPGGAVAWRLYRARGGEGFHYLASGSTDEITDDGTLCSNCQVFPPTVNTTTQNASLSIGVPALPASGASWRLYGRAAAADWPINSFIASGTDATGVITLTSFAPDYGRPPSRSLALRGAHQIDPDTELLDWHWKRAVQNVADLPAGGSGDVRLVYSEGELWGVLASGGAAGPDGWDRLIGNVGPVGPTGDGTITRVSGSGLAPAVVSPVRHLEFGGSGGVGVGVEDLGGGSARVVTGPNHPPQAKATKGSNQNINNNTSTKVTFDATDYDRYYRDTAHFDDANDRLIAREKGLYVVNAFTSFGGNATGYRELIIKKNNTTSIAIVRQSPVAATFAPWLNAVVEVDMDVGDYVEVWDLQTSGGVLAVSTTWLMFRKVSDIP